MSVTSRQAHNFPRFYYGMCRDFGHYWAEIEPVFDEGRLGVSLHRESHGVMYEDECIRLGEWLIEVSLWLSQQKDGEKIPKGPSVYVVGDGAGHYKVGKANDVTQRVKELQTGNVKKLCVVAALQCFDASTALRIENASHRLLSEYKSSGEWFACDKDDAIQAVRSAAKDLGFGGCLVIVGK